MAPSARTTRHIFVTGGVASSLGKGLTASSLGNLLTARGLRVVMQKLDPYLNVDPGTMNPFQHGEVFVTEDGAETDLDVGHYERFLDRDLSGKANVTTGQIYSDGDRQGAARRVPRRHRPGHPAHHQRDQGPDPGDGRPGRATAARPDVVITEVGGTVGDIESLPFLEAIRQVRHDIGRDNCFYLHVSLVPYLAPSRRAEDQADPALGGRAAQHRHPARRDRLPLRPGDPGQAQAQAVALLRRRPRGGHRRPGRAEHLRHPEGAAPRGARRVRRTPARPVLPRRRLEPAGTTCSTGCTTRSRRSRSRWSASTSTCPTPTCRSARRSGPPASATAPGCSCAGCPATTASRPAGAAAALAGVDGIVIPGGFGVRGIEGKIGAARYARENGIPTLGLCLGPAVHDDRGGPPPGRPGRRQLAGVRRRRPRTRSSPRWPTRRTSSRARATWAARCGSGAYPADAGRGLARRRGVRHAPRSPSGTGTGTRSTTPTATQLTKAGLRISGTSPDGRLVEFVELDRELHPFFVATQAHPELKSRPTRPHPLFAGVRRGGRGVRAGRPAAGRARRARPSREAPTAARPRRRRDDGRAAGGERHGGVSAVEHRTRCATATSGSGAGSSTWSPTR